MAACFRILEQAHIKPTDRVIVLGDGKIGLLVAQVLRLTGCQLLVVGRHHHKLAILMKMGMETQLVGNLEGVGKADLVIDCTGSPVGLGLAMELVAPRGSIVLKTTVAEKVQVHLSRLVVDEVTLLGSRCGPFAPAIKALEEGLVKVKPLIWKVYGLGEGLEAMEEASKKEALKVILRMD